MPKPKKPYPAYHDETLKKVSSFVDSVFDSAKITDSGAVLDSASARAFVDESIVRGSNSVVPDKLAVMMEEANAIDPDLGGVVLDSLVQGMGIYVREHGTLPPADLMNQAIHNGYATTVDARRKYKGTAVLDSANSLAADANSLQPNRAISSMLSIFQTAIPFAMYLPADIGSNEARVAILSHQAESAFGEYDALGNMDGVNSGGMYMTSLRAHQGAISVAVGHEGEISGALTTVQTTDKTCDSGAATVKLLSGQSQVYINGIRCGGEVKAVASGNSAVSATITILGVDYSIGGHINIDTGVFLLTSSPALPNTNTVIVEGFIDWERVKDTIKPPQIIADAEIFPYYAKESRAGTSAAIGARTQLMNELGIDAIGQGIMAVNAQFANERHYRALALGHRVGVQRPYTFDFDWSNRKSQLVRAQMVTDLFATLLVVDQTMANDTVNHGATHLYVGKNMLAQFASMGSEYWTPSNITARPGIYWAGTLFGGKYEVYFNPKAVETSNTASKILVVGRATDVSRNPIILGDAVPPMMIPLAVNGDLRYGTGFYVRNFTEQNKHLPSALGFATIDVTNMN